MAAASAGRLIVLGGHELFAVPPSPKRKKRVSTSPGKEGKASRRSAWSNSRRGTWDAQLVIVVHEASVRYQLTDPVQSMPQERKIPSKFCIDEAIFCASWRGRPGVAIAVPTFDPLLYTYYVPN